MIGVDRAVVDELPDAAAFHDRVVVALDQLRFVDQVTGFGVVPARLGSSSHLIRPVVQASSSTPAADSSSSTSISKQSATSRMGPAPPPDHHQVRGVDVEVAHGGGGAGV